MQEELRNLDGRISEVGAHAAALAALHPLEFDRDDKLTISAGMGNYRNKSAAAIGLFYRPNYRTMINMGTTLGDDSNMVNLGFSLKIGRGSTYAASSKADMARIIENQQEEINALREKDKERDALMEEILKKLDALENRV